MQHSFPSPWRGALIRTRLNAPRVGRAGGPPRNPPRRVCCVCGDGPGKGENEGSQRNTHEQGTNDQDGIDPLHVFVGVTAVGGLLGKALGEFGKKEDPEIIEVNELRKTTQMSPAKAKGEAAAVKAGKGPSRP